MLLMGVNTHIQARIESYREMEPPDRAECFLGIFFKDGWSSEREVGLGSFGLILLGWVGLG
jgi:hypothetical protein